MERQKICTKCKQLKPLMEFHICRRNKVDGHAWECKECTLLRRLENKDRKHAYDERRYSTLHEERCAYSRQYRREHNDRFRSCKRSWYERNPENIVYWSMIQRCTDPTFRGYRWYGGRGISVCPRWFGPKGYAFFLADMGKRPGKDYELHRKDIDGVYGPDNCVWLSREEHHAIHNGYLAAIREGV